ncbi:hypothetical protein J1605_015220 [Eschrichtius robustus]|uniref:Coiled-coil domain-containing protein n=1 Tax=Eschrichtius robustus TaxID=9764 RepID=A0AB34GCQ4_ESCRO|nr:hypothetical protein J1605_015220 [Eschrichtius robustus]
MDVLQFTQKDLEVAVKAMQMENLKLKSKYEELHAKCSEMGKITIGFLGMYPGDGEGKPDKGPDEEHSPETIQQKTKESNELLIICYDLISEME